MNEQGIYVPFIVDVEGGMADVADRTERELKRLMDKMSQHALNLKFDIQIDPDGEKKMKSVKSILTDTTLTSEHLGKVIKEILARINDLSNKGGFDLTKGLTESEKDILQAFSVISQKYEGTGLLVKNIISDTQKWADENARSAQEVIEYWSKIDNIINTTGTSLKETTIRMQAAMKKLQVTPAKLDNGEENAEFTRLVGIIKDAQKALFEYQTMLSDVTNTSKENLEVLQEQEQTMSVLNMQMAEWRKILQNSPVGGEEFAEAAREMGILADATAKANFQFKIMSTNTDSVKQISARMSELSRVWSEADASAKFNSDGSLTDWGEDMVRDMEALADLSEKYGKSLEQIVAKRAELKAHQEALFGIHTTMDALNKSLSAWTSELNRAEIDSAQWHNAAQHVQELRDKIQETSDKLREMGFKTGSIDQLNAKLQNLTSQWNNLGNRFDSSGKMTAEARKIYDEYVKATKQLQKEGQAMSEILSKQESITQRMQEQNRIRKRNQLILSSEATTIDRIRQKIQLLTDKLGKTKIGSTKFKQISDDIEVLNKKLLDAQGRTEELNGSMRKSGTLLENLLRKTLYLFSLHTIIGFARNVRSVTAEFELQRVALGSIIQDTEKAESLFKRLKAAAIESPFEIKDLVSYTKQLSAYQIETEKLFDTTMKLADISAGLGVDMGRLILAYGQVRAASVLRGQELRQFTEAGIPLVDKLAKKFSELRGEMVTTGEVFQLISERAVPFRMIEEIFDEMTSAGGEFYKMQEKQAKTLAGQWANLKDSVSIMYDEIGNTASVHRAMENLLRWARSAMLHWKDWLNVIRMISSGLIAYHGIAKLTAIYTDMVAKSEEKAAIAQSLREKNIKKFITALIGKTASEKIATLATDAHTFAINRASAATNGFTAALWRMAAALLNNPFGVAAVAVGSLIALFSIFKNKTRDVSKDIENASASIESFNKTTKDTARLIDQYEELSKKEKLTADEAKKLRDISRELGNVFPRTTEGINQQTGALTLNIEKLKEYNKEAEAAIRKGMQAQLNINQETIRKNQEEIDRITKENNRGWGRNKALGLLSPILFPLSDKRMAENTAEITRLTDENRKLAESNQDLIDTLNGVQKSSEGTVKELANWQDKLIEFNSRVDKSGNALQVVSPDQIENYSKLGDALDEIAKKYKEYTEQEEILKNSIKGKTGEEKKELEGILERTTARKNLAKEELDYYNAFFLTQKKGGSSDRLKALRDEIKEITDAHKKYIELRKYESEEKALSDVSLFFPSLKGWKPSYNNMVSTLERLLSQYRGDADASRIIEQAIANIKFDEAKRLLEEKLKNLSDEIKQSEVARDFYKNILDLTGDNELAASLTMSVYGQTGEDFKERVQRELYEALNSIDPNLIDKGLLSQLFGDATILDFEDLYANINNLPPEVQSVIRKLRGEVESYNAETAKNYTKLLLKFDEMEQQRVNISQKAAKDRLDIEEGLNLEIEGIQKRISDPEKQKELIDSAKKRANAAMGAITREEEFELSKLTREYRLFFSSVGVISESAAKNVAQAQRRMIAEQFARGEKTLAQYKRELNEIDKQLEKYTSNKGVAWTYFVSGIDGVVSKINDFSGGLLAIADNLKMVETEGGLAFSDEDKMYIDKIGSFLGGKIFGVAGRSNTADKLVEAVSAISKTPDEFSKNMKDALIEASTGASNFATQMSQAVSTAGFWVTNISTFIKEMDSINQETEETAKWLDVLASTVTWTLGVAGEGAWDRLAYLNEYATSGFEKFSQGNIVGALIDNIKGLYGMWGPNIKLIDRQIKEQTNLLDELDYQYSRLDVAIEKSFGSDYIYNYNKQLENLEAQQSAYLEQARLEQEKGKKADKDKIKEYENSARDAADKIADMQTQLSEFFSGTDLTSAAEDFASAWIEAYKEFGSTADAMSEKFNEMIESMINRSLAAKIMQEMLQPIFDQIDLLSKDGLLATDEIASIAALAQERIPMINQAMTNLMTSLASAGLDVRTSTAGFKGISRNIANASEESILGLAAAVNTQNFYISYVPQISENVSAILDALTGGGIGGARRAPANMGEDEVMPSVQQMVYDHIPNMDANISEMLRLFRSVITTKNSTTNTNYVAVK